MQDLILIRGLPGSGKSTLAKYISTIDHKRVIVEADMFFMVKGEYKFDASRIGQAHEWCRKHVYDLLMSGMSVVVANTFCTYYEMVPYIQLAHDLTVTLAIVECKGRYESVHGVPPEIIDKMRLRWEQYSTSDLYMTQGA